MKYRTDGILLITFLVSLAFYGFVFANYLEWIFWGSPRWLHTVFNWLAMCFHAVPAFCLQLLLCRKTRRWIAALPGFAVVGLAIWATYGYFTSTGWDSLGYGVLLFLCAAPAVGCVLAWAVFVGWTLYQKNHQ